MPERAVRAAVAASPNISKYAKANDVWISLARHGNNVRLTVRDNGLGFDTAAPQSQRHGLVGMGFRAEAEQGRLRVHSKPGHGTSVVLTLPVSGPAVAQARQEGTGMKG